MNTISLDARWESSSLQTLTVIRRKTLTLKTDKNSDDTSYYISNYIIKDNDLDSANEVIKAIRGHWGDYAVFLFNYYVKQGLKISKQLWRDLLIQQLTWKQCLNK